MKPLPFALLLPHKKVNPLELVRTYTGRFKLGRKVISDEHKAAWLSAEDVIVYSSNIGMAQLAQRLSGVDFVEGFKDFGLMEKTGIDLPYEHTGLMPGITRMDHEIYKATVGYGYGIRVTLMELLRAYNTFNNHGRLVEPKIVAEIVDPLGKRYDVPRLYGDDRQAISPATALRMRRILEKVVEKGTGTKARTPGLQIGGKTGTAHIASRRGGYARHYNSTFIGFANDKTRRFTIGVLVREARKPYHYFAAMSAVPTFKAVVDLMVAKKMLRPDPSLGPKGPPPQKHH
jgi:cell division protein FtsI (penicillin-binding protein 3)